MDFFDGLFNYLQTQSTLSNLIGSPLRLYPEFADERTQKPYAIYSSANTERVVHLKGASAHADYYIDIEVYAVSHASREQVGEALRNILHSRINQVLTDSNNNTVNMEWCELERDHRDMKPPPDGTENSVFCRTMYFRCTIAEAKPTLP